MRATITSLAELRSKSTILGTGFIPVNEENWWFAVGNEKYWKGKDNNLAISFTAIGGHVEEGESFEEATLREIQEETGVEARLYNNNETYVIEAVSEEQEQFNFQIQSLERVEVHENPRPYIMYTAKMQNDVLGVVVYKGSFGTEPHPQMEVPALLCLPPTLLNQTPASLSSLLDSGARIREQEGNTIPREAIIYPFGSASILEKILN